MFHSVMSFQGKRRVKEVSTLAFEGELVAAT